MPSESEPGPSLNQTRQVTIDALCEHFANDAMDVEEFERRVDVAHRAKTLEDLKDLLRDLPGGGVPATVVQSSPVPAAPPSASEQTFAVANADQVREHELVLAVLGGSSRKGRWSPARSNYALAMCGGAHLDFREAVLPPGVTELRVFALCGGVEIVVPPGLNVESHGLALLGGFEYAGGSREPDPGAPTLRVTGVACMGGVDVTVRLPGESSRDARRRLREEHREERRRRRGHRHRRSLPEDR